MDINQFLLKRKQRKINYAKNKKIKAKHVFKKSKQSIQQEQENKLLSDPLSEKKKKFYEELFKGKEEKTEGNIPLKNDTEEKMATKEIGDQSKTQKITPNIQKKNKPLPFSKEMKKKNQKIKEEENVKRQQELTKNREKKMVKKIFKERTKTNQPVMKNYINYLLHKIENPKKS